MCRCAASSGGLEALRRPAHRRASGPGAYDHPWAVVVTLLQARHHGLTGDGAELVREGAVEDQDVHREDPLADGGSVLQDEALVDEEDAAWEEERVKEHKHLRDTSRTKRALCELNQLGVKILDWKRLGVALSFHNQRQNRRFSQDSVFLSTCKLTSIQRKENNETQTLQQQHS